MIKMKLEKRIIENKPICPKEECEKREDFPICFNQLYQRCFYYLQVNGQLPIKPLGETRRWNQL